MIGTRCVLYESSTTVLAVSAHDLLADGKRERGGRAIVRGVNPA